VFTGLIADVGTVAEVDTGPDGARLILHSALGGEVSAGDSISVNGVCLTATRGDGEGVHVEVMHQTLRHSALGRLVTGSRVNLELAVRAADRLGGHLVQGHVDGVAAVSEVSADGFAARLRVALEAPLLRYVVARGSIALDGVSLTVADVDDGHLSVALVPETRERTTLGAVEPGHLLNVEVDVLAKYVERLMASAVRS